MRCVALCKSAYASAKEEKTASSIVQFECVSLLVRLTCQHSYPTSHSCLLKNSSDPGITFRSLTVVRNISFFLCEAWTTCSVLYSASSAESVILLCAACNDVSEHAYLVYSSVSVDGKEKKKIQIKKTIRPTESSFQGLRDRKQGLFCIGLMKISRITVCGVTQLFTEKCAHAYEEETVNKHMHVHTHTNTCAHAT